MSRLLSVSVPDALVAETESLAEAQGKSKSEVVREALGRHVKLERFHAVQRFGREQAERRGLGPEDAEALVDQMRTEPS